MNRDKAGNIKHKVKHNQKSVLRIEKEAETASSFSMAIGMSSASVIRARRDKINPSMSQNLRLLEQIVLCPPNIALDSIKVYKLQRFKEKVVDGDRQAARTKHIRESLPHLKRMEGFSKI